MVLRLTSPAFDDGTAIPRQYGYRKRNVNPPLVIEGVPEGTGSLALVVDDPDAMGPAGKVWDHWVVWNVSPDVGEIPDGWNAARTGAEEGTNDYGSRGYGGPNPPNREHTYRFRLFALDSTLDLPPSTDVDGLVSAATGHVVEETTLTGTYSP